ncbi:MAG: hypothetical protein E4H11_02135 [Myxococcales bacterium]|nr:MAG: hypothetical protein E4H11_02135 [Myxococcales bacterium]
MSCVPWVRSRARLALLVARSGAALPGPRRADHPFISGLRSGQVVPHQGGHWPGEQPNTIAAFQRAAPRSQILDIDVWMTADGVVVCSHDDAIGPTRRISTSTWAELETETTVPRLTEVATMFPEHRLNIEVKDARAVAAIHARARKTRRAGVGAEPPRLRPPLQQAASAPQRAPSRERRAARPPRSPAARAGRSPRPAQSRAGVDRRS